jgi:hypothetical protein
MKEEELLKVIFISMQVYNRRRAGKIEKVLIEDYKCYKSPKYRRTHRSRSV